MIFQRTSLFSLNYARNTAVIHEWEQHLDGKRINLISQGDDGLDFNRINYELYPNNRVFGHYSVALTPYFTESEDPWTFIATPDAWEEYILNQKFDLVYIFNYDEKFIETYGKFFPNGVTNNMLYCVKTENRQLLLVPII